MTTTYFEMALDRVPCHTEPSSQRSDGPSFSVQDGQEDVVFLAQFGLGAAPHVDRASDWLDVIGIDASPHATEMVGLQARGPRPYSFLPDSPVSDHSFPLQAGLSIALGSDCGPHPNPARSGTAPILNREIPLIDESFAKRHTDTSYRKEAHPHA